MRLSGWIGAGALVLVSVTAQTVEAAPRPSYSLVWIIQPSNDAYPLTIEVKDGDMILRQKLLPQGLAVLGEDVMQPDREGLVLKGGSQLVQLVGSDGVIYCGLKTRRADKTGLMVPARSGTTLCLKDSDGNGRFDIAFAGLSSPTGIIMSAQVPKAPSPVDVSFTVRSSSEIEGEFWVGLRYEQYFNIYGNRMLMTDFGGLGTQQSLTAFDTFKSKGPFPRTVGALGANMTIVSAQEKGVTVKVVNAMPQQPFGVATYTTYRLY